MRYYFHLQYTRTERRMADLGLSLPVAVSLALAALVGGAIFLYGRFELAPWILVLLTVTALWPLSAGDRYDRVVLLFPADEARRIRLIEHFVGGGPVLLVLLGFGSWVAGGVLAGLLVVMAVLRRRGFMGLILPTPFRTRPYECIAGFRRYGWVLPVLYFLTWQGVLADNVNLVRFTSVAGGILVMSFYSETPPPELLRMYRGSARDYLIGKLQTGYFAYTLFALPVWVALFAVWPAGWPLHVATLCLGYLYIPGMILVKYAAYPKEPPFLRSVAQMLGMVFPPLLLVLLHGWYREATFRLNLLLP